MSVFHMRAFRSSLDFRSSIVGFLAALATVSAVTSFLNIAPEAMLPGRADAIGDDAKRSRMR